MQLTQRIEPLDVDVKGLPPLNIFKTLAHNPPLSRGFLALGSHLLRAGGLPARERELVILRVGWRSESEYEFGQHTQIGLAEGLTDEEVARVASNREGWSLADAALIALADELCDHNVVSEGTWATLAERWSEPELLELLVLAGYYRLVSGMLNSAGVALEPGTPGWPVGVDARLRAPRA
ncbi:MAG: carboxymuconolactone decarboxylase family protein [Mycobacteriales bacterium]